MTQPAPIKDNVITAPIVPVYMCWWEEIIDMSELIRGCQRAMNQKAACVRKLQPYVALIKDFFHNRVNKQQRHIISPYFFLFTQKQKAGCWGGSVGKGRDLNAKPEVSLSGALYTAAAIHNV